MFTLQLHPHDTGAASVAESFGGRRVQEWRDEAELPCVHGYTGDGWWAMEWPGWATFRFGGDGAPVDVFHRPDIARDRLDETYRRSVLPLQLQALGYETLHASAFSIDGRTIAFCGRRRSGKSTLAYALASRGLPHRADDTLVLAFGSNGIVTVPLPFAPRLRPQSAEFFGATESRVTTATTAEALAGVVILEQDTAVERSQIETLQPAVAFRDVLAHAHCFEPDSVQARARLVRHYLELAASVPIRRLHYRPGLNDLDRLADELLEALDWTAPVAP